MSDVKPLLKIQVSFSTNWVMSEGAVEQTLGNGCIGGQTTPGCQVRTVGATCSGDKRTDQTVWTVCEHENSDSVDSDRHNTVSVF